MYIHRLHPEIIQFTDTIAIRWYGLSYLAGFLAGYFLLKGMIRKKQLNMGVQELQDCLTSFAIFGVMLGGRLGYFLFYAPETVLNDPLQLVRVWEGGMASHGGILGGILVLLWWSRRHKVTFWNLTDCFAVVCPLGIGLGRLANFINGELWGKPTGSDWGVVFPLELPQFNPGGSWEQLRYDLPALTAIVEGGGLSPRHPSQLYQAAGEGFLLFALLYVLRQSPWSQAKAGRLSMVFLLGYALARFGVEFFREPDASLLFGWMTRGQFLSLFMILGAGVCLKLLSGRSGATRTS